jgi:hypothetical protein
MRVGVIDHCLNCGADIGPDTFPHYCDFCVGFLRVHRVLPSGLLEQMHLQDDVDLPVGE